MASLSSSDQTEDERNGEHHEEDEKQDFRDFRGPGRNPAKAEQSRD
jgi:hypothetical protein